MSSPYESYSTYIMGYRTNSAEKILNNRFANALNALQRKRPIILRQHDFSNGTISLNSDSHYRLGEDIVIDFTNTDFFHSDPEFVLGNYAGISIHGKNILLDGGGFTISMKKTFWRKQRFFSLIQLNKGPFANFQGPVNFGDGRPFSDTVIIRNLNMGLTSHHAILGNQAKYVLFENLNIRDFEVAGISLNGCDYIKYNNVDIHDNIKTVPFSARLSQAICLLQLFSNLKSVPADLQAESSAVRDLVDKQLEMDINQVLENFENHNVNKRPDCGSFYGINSHAVGVAINGFDSSANKQLNFISFNNVSIHDIIAAPVEALGLRYVDENGVLEDKPLTDIQGSIYPPNIEDILSDTTHPEHSIWKFSVSLSKLGTLGRPYIKNNTWKEGEGNGTYRVHRHADAMNHLVKGVIGLSVGSFKYGNVKNLAIYNITNDADWIGISSGHVIHPAGPDQSYMGMWVNGVVLANTNYDITQTNSISISSLKSELGPEFKCRKINDNNTRFTLFT